MYDNKDGRLRGRKAKARRELIWSRSPYCAMCGRLVVLDYPGPNAFELDHTKALANGGKDVDDNLQVLCCGPDGCHAKKTAADLKRRQPVKIGVDGWPEVGEH